MDGMDGINEERAADFEHERKAELFKSAFPSGSWGTRRIASGVA